MDFYYPPDEILPGPSYQLQSQTTIGSNGSDTVHFRNIPRGFGLTTLQVVSSDALDVDVRFVTGDGTSYLLKGVRDRVLEHAFNALGYEVQAPIEVPQGAELQFVLDNTTNSQVTTTVHVRGLTAEQREIRETNIWLYRGSVPTTRFAYASFTAAGNTITPQDVNVPTGPTDEWVFDRVFLDVKNAQSTIPLVSLHRGGGDQPDMIFEEIPFSQEKIELTPWEVLRPLTLEVDYTDESNGGNTVDVDALIPVYDRSSIDDVEVA